MTTENTSEQEVADRVFFPITPKSTDCPVIELDNGDVPLVNYCEIVPEVQIVDPSPNIYVPVVTPPIATPCSCPTVNFTGNPASEGPPNVQFGIMTGKDCCDWDFNVNVDGLCHRPAIRAGDIKVNMKGGNFSVRGNNSCANVTYGYDAEREKYYIEVQYPDGRRERRFIDYNPYEVPSIGSYGWDTASTSAGGDLKLHVIGDDPCSWDLALTGSIDIQMPNFDFDFRQSCPNFDEGEDKIEIVQGAPGEPGGGNIRLVYGPKEIDKHDACGLDCGFGVELLGKLVLPGSPSVCVPTLEVKRREGSEHDGHKAATIHKDTDTEFICTTCDGSGYVDGAVCQDCNGFGRVWRECEDTENCRICGGSGYITNRGSQYPCPICSGNETPGQLCPDSQACDVVKCPVCRGSGKLDDLGKISQSLRESGSMSADSDPDRLDSIIENSSISKKLSKFGITAEQVAKYKENPNYVDTVAIRDFLGLLSHFDMENGDAKLALLQITDEAPECPTCSGHGYLCPSDCEKVSCPACNGKGYIEASWDSEVHFGCTACNGVGFFCKPPTGCAGLVLELLDAPKDVCIPRLRVGDGEIDMGNYGHIRLSLRKDYGDDEYGRPYSPETDEEGEFVTDDEGNLISKEDGEPIPPLTDDDGNPICDGYVLDLDTSNLREMCKPEVVGGGSVEIDAGAAGGGKIELGIEKKDNGCQYNLTLGGGGTIKLDLSQMFKIVKREDEFDDCVKVPGKTVEFYFNNELVYTDETPAVRWDQICEDTIEIKEDGCIYKVTHCRGCGGTLGNSAIPGFDGSDFDPDNVPDNGIFYGEGGNKAERQDCLPTAKLAIDPNYQAADITESVDVDGITVNVSTGQIELFYNEDQGTIGIRNINHKKQPYEFETVNCGELED